MEFRMVDLITKKRDGMPLSKEEIHFFIDGYVKGIIPDYQVSALLMAIVFQGMNENETVNLTSEMLSSGDRLNLEMIKGIKVDKHSTGGVGDKTSLVLGPIVASLGAKLAKMSGRGLGHTGGTLDKMEAIPGMRINLTIDEFIHQVNDIGIAIVGQTSSLVPADKKLYALRDVTGTVESLPLIASSVMSKKLASGSDAILLDVKFGNGAFMKTKEDAIELAKVMVKIGRALKKDTRAIITDMEQPLGLAIGNALEVKEAIATLKGHGPKDLEDLCIYAGSVMLNEAKIVTSLIEGTKLIKEAISSGKALSKFKEFVKAQGGDVSYIDDVSKFPVAKYVKPIIASSDGYLKEINALEIGEGAMKLGAGRATYDDVIDLSAGIILNKKVGDYVHQGDVLCYMHTNKEDVVAVEKEIHDAFKLTNHKVEPLKVVHEYIK